MGWSCPEGTALLPLPLMTRIPASSNTMRAMPARITTGRNRESPVRRSGVGSLRVGSILASSVEGRVVSIGFPMPHWMRRNAVTWCGLLFARASGRPSSQLHHSVVVMKDIRLFGDWHLDTIAGGEAFSALRRSSERLRPLCHPCADRMSSSFRPRPRFGFRRRRFRESSLYR